MSDAAAAASAVDRATVLVSLGRSDDALAVIDAMLTSESDNADLLLARGWVLLKLGRAAEALQVLSDVLTTSPDDVSVLRQVAFAHSALGNDQAAEDAAERALALMPENPALALHVAQLLISGNPRLPRRIRKTRTQYARELIDTALASAPDDPTTLRDAASLAWQLGEVETAQRYVREGLANAPDDTALLSLNADLTVASTVPTSRHDEVTVEATAVAEAAKLLAHDPQNAPARRIMFAQLWWQRFLLNDAPLGMLGILAVVVGSTMRRTNSPGIAIIVAGVVIIGILGIGRLIAFAIVTRSAPQSFRALFPRQSPAALVRHALNLGAWIVVPTVIVGVFVVRDGAAVRWLIVALGIASLAAVVNAILWVVGYSAAARRIGGLANDVESLGIHQRLRSQLLFRLIPRVLGAGVLGGMCVAFSTGGRVDVIPVAMLAANAMLLTPLAGAVAVMLAERAARRQIPDGVVIPRAYRAPTIGLIVSALIGAAFAIGVVAAAVQLPFAANVFDDDGVYPLTSPGSNDGPDEDACTGRPASRLTCIIEQQQNIEMPTFDPIEIPDFEIPTIEVPEVELPPMPTPTPG